MLVTLFNSNPFHRRLMALAGRWQRWFQVASNRYRPERHYMRGPGPAWHARQRAQNGI
jgi:hypothetical protein